jgi:hypothetical protein
MSNHIGSKYFNPRTLSERDLLGDSSRRVMDTPNVWIGEVSWLKAALFDGGTEEYVPTTVQAISDMIGEDLPVLDDDLIGKILGAFDAPNQTPYRLADTPGALRSFLNEWKGLPVFTISW